MTIKTSTNPAEIRILSVTELDAVTGGSLLMGIAIAGVQGAVNGPRQKFPIAPRTGSGDGGGKCSSNHNGVRY
jgi:hypothetical protein